MRIGLVSDSHSRRKTTLPEPLVEAFRGVDMILHAGDICDLDFLRALSDIAYTEAVAGNNENDVMRNNLGLSKIIEVGDLRIGLVHGHLGKGRTTLLRAFNTFEHGEVDIIVFGHSHEPYDGMHGSVRMINPGSLTRPRGKDRRPSVGVLTIEDGTVKYELVRWEK